MRDILNILDQLSEATISKYPVGTMFSVSDSKAGQQLATKLSQHGVDTSAPMELIAWPAKNPWVVLGTGKGPANYAFKVSSGPVPVWGFSGGVGGLDAAMVHYHGGNETVAAKLSNRGETAEGILGAAMFAKFTKRESNENLGLVTVNDVLNVLNQLKTVGEDTYQLVVKDADNKHADTVTFLLRLKTNPYQDLMDPTKRELLAKDFASAVGYVNSSMAERYSKYFYLNGKADEIAVIADGAATESEKKTDVWVAVRDAAGKMRQLKLNTSLKVGGIAQFGQVGGSEQESMIRLWGYFGIDPTPLLDSYKQKHSKDPFQALAFLYKSIAKQLAAKLAGDDDAAEARFVDNLAHAVTFFATLGDPNVELVDFDKGGFKILRFKNLITKLRDVNLTATYLDKKTRPEISIHDVDNPKRELLSIRVKIENRTGGIYVRNIIEKGPLLEELTKIQQRSWKELETPDPEATRVQLRPKRAPKVNKPAGDPGLGRERR